MELVSEELDDGILRINLSGRMDNAGVQSIDMKFTALTATRKALIVVDLSGVPFVASIGIRTLVSNARALRLRGGRMALFGAQPVVDEVLRTTGITTIIPTYADLQKAREALKAPAEQP